MDGPTVPLTLGDLRAALRLLRDEDDRMLAEYNAAPKCHDCGYPDYMHPFYGGLHQFNDAWANAPSSQPTHPESADPE
jgi:hypothetical protein